MRAERHEKSLICKMGQAGVGGRDGAMKMGLVVCPGWDGANDIGSQPPFISFPPLFVYVPWPRNNVTTERWWVGKDGGTKGKVSLLSRFYISIYLVFYDMYRKILYPTIA